MSTWLEQFAAQLEGIENSRGAVTRGDSSKDAALRLLAMRGTSGHAYTKDALESAGKSNNDFAQIGHAAASGGSRLMDILSRGMYASANFKDYQQEAAKNNRTGYLANSLDTLGDIPHALKGAWKGAIGKEKTTYSDVLEHGGWEDGTPGRGTLGFILDVGLDPTTYVGAGAIRAGLKGGSKGVQVVTKALGHEADLTKLGRSKNVLRPNDVLDPVEKGKLDLATKGTTNSTEPVVQRLLAEAAKKSKPGEGQLPFTVERGGKVSDRAVIDGAVDAAPDVIPGQTAMDFVASAAHDSAKRELDTVLNDIPDVRRYPKNLAVPHPFREVEEVTEKAVPVTKTREVPNPDFKQANDVLKEGINRLVTENFDSAKKGFKVWGRTSKDPVAKLHLGSDDIAYGGKELAEEGATATRETVGQLVDRLPPKTLAGWVKTGKIPKSMEGYHFVVDGQRVKISDYVSKLHSEYDDAGSVFNENTIVEHYKDIEMRSVTTKKLKAMDPMERTIWAHTLKDVLDPEDLAHLYRTANLGPRAFATAFNKIKDKQALRSFNSARELADARDAGLIGETGLQVLKGRLETVGASNVFNIEKKVNRLKKALDEASAKPTKANKAKVKEANSAVENAVKKADLRLDAEDIMQTPQVKENVAARVAHAYDNNDVSDWTRAQEVLNEKQAAAVNAILKDVGVSELSKAGKPFRTNRGVMRDSPNFGQGHGWAKGFNKYSQMTLGKRVISAASKMVRGESKAARPAAMYDMTMPMLHASEQVLRQNGIPLILGKGATGLPLSMHDVLSALPREFVEKYYFNPAHSFDITQLADVVEQHLLLGLGERSADDVNAAVEGLLSKYKRPNKAGTSTLTASLKGNVSATAKEIEGAFAQAGPKIMEALSKNSAEAAIKYGDETRALTDAGMEAFNKVVTDPNATSGSVIRAALESYNPVRVASKARDIPVSGQALAQAEQATAAHVAATLPMPVVATYAKAGESFKKASGYIFKGNEWHSAPSATNDFAKIQVKLADSADVEAKSILEILQGVDPATFSTLDLGQRAEFTDGVRIFRAIAPHLGNENLRPILTERLSVQQSLSKRFTEQLGRVNATVPKAEAAEAFARLQAGETASTPAMEAMQSVMKEIFDKDPAYGILTRNGIRIDALHDKFKKFGIGDIYKMDPKNPELSWQKWPTVEDPLDLMSKYHAAISAVVAENQIGADISRMFGRRAPGTDGKWVQIRDTQGKSKLASLINKDLYFPEDISRQMHMIDETLAELAKPNSDNKFLKVLDSALHSYKAGVTIYRPGHHVRNMIGDMWLSSMDGVTPSAYKRATAVMGTRKSQYADFDALRALQAAYSTEGVVPKTVLSLTIDGKKIALSPDQIYRMAFDSGALPDYSVLEDVAFGATQQADKVAETLKNISPFKGKLHKVAAGTSEYRDHYVRIAHFIHSLENGGAIKTGLKGVPDSERIAAGLKQASHVAGSRVRKWHPDGSDLSDFEKRYARRTILFYSWVRKAIPLVVESMVTKPGRVMLYPKAMQNIAAENGIDIEGLGNPFPSDQLFPSYIADSVQGPQWGSAGQYMGVKPGIPSMDVLDDYASSPTAVFRNIMGSVNPLFKVPFEAATGTQVRTGTPIMDKTDYIDAQLPGANYIGKLAGGKSASSGFTQDTRVSPSNVGYEGNPNSPGQGASDFINWLLGLGMTDYSRPSSIVSAQREQRGR